MAALGGDVDGVFVEVEAVDEGRRAELDLVLLEQLLQVDFPHVFAALHVPVDEFGVVAGGEAQVLLLRFYELDGVDDVEVALVQQLHAFEVVVVEPGVALVVSCGHDALRWLYFDDGELVEVGLLVLLAHFLHENAFLADVEAVHELS